MFANLNDFNDIKIICKNDNIEFHVNIHNKLTIRKNNCRFKRTNKATSTNMRKHRKSGFKPYLMLNTGGEGADRGEKV